MKRSLLCLSMGLLVACGPITQQDKLKDLDRQIKLEQQRQELERLRRQNQPTPAPSAAEASARPASTNQPPRLTQLEARLRTSVKADDTVELVASATDPDGDSLEFTWASVFTGLSATRGQSVVWFPGDQELAGRSNLISLTVSDKKGGTSTGTLNIYVQADGTLLVKQNLAAQPVLQELAISQPDPGQLRLKAKAIDPGGGTVRYSWRASKGLLGSTSTDTATWSASGSETGEVVISLQIANGDGTAQTQLDYRFTRLADGSLQGDFRTIRGATALATPSASPGTGADTGATLQGTVYSQRDGAIVSASLATGQQLELFRLNQIGGPGLPNQMLYDGQDTLYLLGNGVHALSLSRLDTAPVNLPESGVQRLFTFQGQACALTSSAGSPKAYVLSSGRSLALKNPEWLYQGQIGSQGLVAAVSNLVVQVSDPVHGIQQDWLDLKQNGAAMAWHPDGGRLAVIEGLNLHVLGLDGSKTNVPVKRAPQSLIWLNEHTLLGVTGQPGKLDVWAIDPTTGDETVLSSALRASLATLSQLVPAP